jgi:hypothetical protein
LPDRGRDDRGNPMSMSTFAVGRGPAPTQSLRFIIAASEVGTLIEWCDFYIYGVLAVGSGGVSLIETGSVGPRAARP